jgi:DNA-binding MarR family transcriptional regulator
VTRTPDDEDYTRLLELRTGLRRFLRWSERQAAAAGLTPAQHQLLLAIRGHRGEDGPTIGDVAESLLVKHHTASELVSRAQDLGLVERERDERDNRRVHLRLTAKGNHALQRLTAVHLEEVRRLAGVVGDLR